MLHCVYSMSSSFTVLDILKPKSQVILLLIVSVCLLFGSILSGIKANNIKQQGTSVQATVEGYRLAQSRLGRPANHRLIVTYSYNETAERGLTSDMWPKKELPQIGQSVEVLVVPAKNSNLIYIQSSDLFWLQALSLFVGSLLSLLGSLMIFKRMKSKRGKHPKG